MTDWNRSDGVNVLSKSRNRQHVSGVVLLIPTAPLASHMPAGGTLAKCSLLCVLGSKSSYKGVSCLSQELS